MSNRSGHVAMEHNVQAGLRSSQLKNTNMETEILINKLEIIKQIIEPPTDLNWAIDRIDLLISELNPELRKPAVSWRSEQLYLCPVCNEKTGKSYLLSKLPTICQKCDHAWNRA